VEVEGNYKSQNPNNKQITITEIQNPKPSHHLKKENSKYVWVIEYWKTPMHLTPQKSLLPLETMSQFAEPVIPDEST